MEGYEVCYTSGIQIESKINELLQIDNKDLMDRHPTLKANNNFQAAIIEDIKCKLCKVMDRNQMKEYLSSEENI